MIKEIEGKVTRGELISVNAFPIKMGLLVSIGMQLASDMFSRDFNPENWTHGNYTGFDPVS